MLLLEVEKMTDRSLAPQLNRALGKRMNGEVDSLTSATLLFLKVT